MVNKEHLNIDGLHKIIAIKSSMNLGISEIIISNFKKVNSVDRPKILIDNIPEANWVAGFTTGEGNFDINIYKSKDVKIGHRVQLRIRILQHERDLKLIELLIKYLKSGRIEKDSRTSVVNLTIYKITDITNIIIPFFEKHPIQG